MAIPDIENFRGSITLTAQTGCTIQFDALIEQVNLDRTDKEAMVGSFAFVSDGDPTAVVWDETGPTATTIEGLNADVTMPAGFNLDKNAWVATINSERVTWATFASFWKNNKPGNAEITGTVTGVVQFDAANTQPFPTV